MSRFFAALVRFRLLLVAAVFILVWVVWVVSALRPRLALSSIDRSRAILASGGGEASILRATSDGKNQTQAHAIDPVITWKNGLVYWDNTKPCLFYAASGQKPKAVWLRPKQPGLFVASLVPAPDGVYINATLGAKPGVLFVHLPDGKTRLLPKVQELRGSERGAAFGFRTPKDTLAVRYPDGKQRTASYKKPVMNTSWDYDPVRDALVYYDDEGHLCYESSAQSWRKNSGGYGYGMMVNPATGDVWARTSGSFGGDALSVYSPTGVERGWRLRGSLPYALRYMELSPEQEILARTLPNRK